MARKRYRKGRRRRKYTQTEKQRKGQRGEAWVSNRFADHKYRVIDVSRSLQGMGDLKILDRKRRGRKEVYVVKDTDGRKWLVEVKDVDEFVRQPGGQRRHGRPYISKRAHKQLLLNASSMDATPIYVVKHNKQDNGRKVEMRYLSSNQVSRIIRQSKAKKEVTPSMDTTKKFDWRSFRRRPKSRV